MSRKPRFQPVETFNRNGRVVAHILDTKSGRHHWLHRQGQSLLEWDKEDAPVQNGLLRHAARLALDTYQEELRLKAGEPCIKCGEPFMKQRNAKTCPNCISKIGERNGLLAHEGAGA